MSLFKWFKGLFKGSSVVNSENESFNFYYVEHYNNINNIKESNVYKTNLNKKEVDKKWLEYSNTVILESIEDVSDLDILEVNIIINTITESDYKELLEIGIEDWWSF